MKIATTLFLSILLCSEAMSQITLTYTDAQSIFAAGKSQLNLSAYSLNLTMNVGTPSSSAQTWQVPSVTFTDTVRIDNVLPSATPYASQFPRATHVQRMVMKSNGTTQTGYSYMRITVDSVISLGYASRLQGPGQDTTMIDKTVSLDVLLPIQLGKTFTRRDSIPIMTGSYIIQRFVSTCDAFGSLVTSAGTFQTLRIREVSYSETYFAGQLYSKDSSTSINLFTREGYSLNLEPKDNHQYSGSIVVGGVSYTIPAGSTGIADQSTLLPNDLVLHQNYPNPFNPSTTIEYALPTSGNATLTIHNLLGQEVALLVNGFQEAGFHTLRFDAAKIPSGVYFYRLTLNDRVCVGRMTVLK